MKLTKLHKTKNGDGEIAGITLIAILVLIIICGALWGCPQYNVYSQRLDGEGQLAHSVASRQVAVSEAKAKNEAAELLAQAEVKRAEGVAKANKIIGDSLAGDEGQAYLRYLWINNLEKQGNPTVIYIPTEAGLPILEAGKR